MSETLNVKVKRQLRVQRVVWRRYKYMHTLNSMPAHYYPGEQICYAVRTRPIPLCNTLAQIRREQRATVAYRKAEGFEYENKSFGWMKVESPNGELTCRGKEANES